MRRPLQLPTPALDTVLAAMIEQHAGRACPTRRDVVEWTGMIPRRRIWPYLYDMQARGLLEIDADKADERRHRLRVAGGTWTGWTARHETHKRQPKA